MTPRKQGRGANRARRAEQSWVPLAAEAAVGLLLFAAVMLLMPRMPQNPSYHSFAGDERPLLGISHGANVLSNAPISLPGLAALWLLLSWWRRGHPSAAAPTSPRTSTTGASGGTAGRRRMQAAEATCWAAAFFGMLSLGFTSGYYHLQPSNARLVWDRLSIATTFASLVAALTAQRRSSVAGLSCLLVLLPACVCTALYWGASEAAGRGDLRPYGLAQGGSAFACLYLVLARPPPPGSTNRPLLSGLALYAAAMAMEAADRPVYQLTAKMVSGHTLKHLLAAAAGWQVLQHVRQRAGG